jgi:outer membrane protein assembly factor BamB
MLVGLALLAVVFSGCDWTMIGFDTANTHSTPDTSLNMTSVQDLVPAFSGTTGGGEVFGSPVVAQGLLYVVAYTSSSQVVSLDAFDATGNSCNQRVCQPKWTAPLGSTATAPSSSPAVVNGVVYAGSSNNLEAFDAAGVTNCTGTPKTCAPLWRASVGPVRNSAPVVANGVVYIGSTDDDLYAFDAAGVTNCSGTPKTCDPLWSAKTGGAIQAAPTVANGVIYLGSTDDDLYAFDAAGKTNCSGTPKTCSPLWSAATSAPIEVSAAVADGVVYVGTAGVVLSPDNLYAFDAAGVTNCSGTPKSCSPLWLYDVLSNAVGAPAVADGHVYVGVGGHIQGSFAAFDAAGNTNCSGTPTICEPLWTADAGLPAAVANGLVYVSSVRGISVYDEAGHSIMTLLGEPFGEAIVANGLVYQSIYQGSSPGFFAFAILSTQILVPSNGSSVSGTTVLDASVTPQMAASQVQFVASGGSLSNHVVGTATLTYYGWIAEWDTTTVPNGTYTLQSVATDPVLASPVMSSGITITVNNSSS